MSDINLLILIGNIFFLISYLIKDIFLLRVIVVGALLLFIINSTILAESINSQTVFWNIVFISINIRMLVQAFNERKIVVLSPRVKEIHKNNFSKLTVKQFDKMMKIAEKKHLEVDQNIIANAQSILFLEKGTLTTSNEEPINSQTLLSLQEIITENDFTKDYTSQTPADLIIWDKEKLDKLLKSDAELKANWQGQLSQELIKRLNKK